MLLDELKAYLKITWDEEDEDLLIPTINNGKSKLNNIVGADIDFDNDEEARALLLDYCRYRYNNAVEYFEQNFISDLVRLQIKYLKMEL